MDKGFESVMGKMSELSRDLRSSASPPSRGGPPRRSFGPRRNLSDVTCYACGSKGHYARDCKGSSFATLPIQKQEEVQGALHHAPIGDFTMAVVWEQYAPNDSSQSLEEALDNLHRWSFGGPKTEKLQTAFLTALPQVDVSLLPPSPSFKVTPLSWATFVYSGMPLSGATSLCSPLPVQDLDHRPETGWSIKFWIAAMPEIIVHGSTLEAPSCGGKKRGHGISGRLHLARPMSRGGCTEHPTCIRRLNFKCSSSTRQLRNASCFRPVAGERHKIEDPSKWSRTFRKKQPESSRWSSHEDFGEV